MWIVEKLITWNFEFLSVSYLMSEFVFFFAYWMLQDYVHVSDVPPTSIVLVDSMTGAQKLQTVLENLPEQTALTSKEKEVLELVLEGKSRKEIAALLHVSENTVKTHLTHLYEKCNVSGREELLALSYQK
ncbi:MAG: helix-turn-helix transcriptional regulator [Ruminococcaceae bacterium]|nr:helix-turn-helix transcriptional regulator [Oscillospiraceae bacterium]